MTDTTATDAPRLWTSAGFRDDEWRHAEDADALAAGDRVILPLAAWQALEPAMREELGEQLGVLLTPGEPVDRIVEQLPSLPLVALSFPAFNDGRSFSKAALLRSRHRFGGIIRATGQILIDQLPHMLRLGFDEFEVSHPVLIARLEAGRIDGLPLYYQPAARAAAGGERYSWRRRPAA